MQKRPSKRYGAAELYGMNLTAHPQETIRELLKSPNQTSLCPFKPGTKLCHKRGGVCSIARYGLGTEGIVDLVDNPVTVCPSRFLQSGLVFRWVGETLLGIDSPKVVNEVSFLMAEREDEAMDEVGRIDNVLVDAEGGGLKWCALEMQAVYFSGGKMEDDFAAMRNWTGPGLPFPAKQRRPDFRSSGPKRLMPQLQIKVPTLRRWGRKMAVVVDLPFWNSLGKMRRADHLSNADIAWFILRYQAQPGENYQLEKYDAVFTTLENAVEGLTGGTPVSLAQFEALIRQKLERT